LTWKREVSQRLGPLSSTMCAALIRIKCMAMSLRCIQGNVIVQPGTLEGFLAGTGDCCNFSATGLACRTGDHHDHYSSGQQVSGHVPNKSAGILLDPPRIAPSKAISNGRKSPTVISHFLVCASGLLTGMPRQASLGSGHAHAHT
jgi:hypothetical protein